MSSSPAFSRCLNYWQEKLLQHIHLGVAPDHCASERRHLLDERHLSLQGAAGHPGSRAPRWPAHAERADLKWGRAGPQPRTQECGAQAGDPILLFGKKFRMK